MAGKFFFCLILSFRLFVLSAGVRSRVPLQHKPTWIFSMHISTGRDSFFFFFLCFFVPGRRTGGGKDCWEASIDG